MVVSGAQHGLTVTAMALLQPGDVVAVDAVTYPGFKVLAEMLRLEPAPIPTTQDRPDLNALEQLCAQRHVRAVYAVPTLHNPLGWVMDSASRNELVETARRHGPRAHHPRLGSLHERRNRASGRLRRTPTQHVAAVERTIRATTWNTPALTAAIACRWVADGSVERLETDKRRDTATRQVVARQALAGFDIVGHPGNLDTLRGALTTVRHAVDHDAYR